MVREQETNSHRRSMVVGDFNAQPFESAVLSWTAFMRSGFGSEREAMKLQRRRQRHSTNLERRGRNP